MRHGLIILTLFLAFCPRAVYAATAINTENILQFNCGLNSLSSPFSLRPCEMTEAQNVNLVLDGSVVRRDGNALLGGQIDANDVTALYDFHQTDGSQDLVAVAGTVIAKTDSLDGTWDTITGSVSLTADVLRDCITHRGELLCTDDTSTDGTWQWTGSGNAADWDTNFSAGGSIEKAKYIALYHNYIFLANVELNGGTAHNSRFYWSDLDDSDTWRATQFIDVEPDDDCGGIGGMRVLGERLVIYKERCGVWNVLFTADSDIPFILEKSLCEIGTDAGFTIKTFSNNHIFYSPNRPGIYLYNGVACREISQKIEPTILGFDEGDSTKMVAGIHAPLDQYWLGIQSAGVSENDRVIVWDLNNDAFSIHTGIEPSFMATVSKSGVRKLYTGDYSGYVLEQDTGNTDVLDGTTGQTIDSSIKTAWFPLGKPSLRKSLDHTMVYHALSGNYNMNFGYSYDFHSMDEYTASFSVFTGGALWDLFDWDDGTLWASTGGGYVSRIDMRGSGGFIRYHIHKNADVASWELYGITPIFRYERVLSPSALE